MRNINVFLKISAVAAAFAFCSCSDNERDDGKRNPPAKPQGLFALAGKPNEITLRWSKDTSADAADYYDIYISDNREYSSKQSRIYGNEKTISKLSPSTKYYFKLTAVNRFGASDTSDVACEKTLIDAPKNLSAALLPNNDLMLQWDAVTDNENVSRGNGGGSTNGDNLVKYKVYLSGAIFAEYGFAGETDETRMKFADLDKAKTHYFKVAAVDSQEREGAKSDYVSASVPSGLPATPQGLSAVLQSGGKIYLSWNSVGSANEYRVYYSTAPEILYEYYAPTEKTTMLVNNIATGPDYYFKVSALNSNGEGEKSPSVVVKTF